MADQQIDLDELEALAKAASPGYWEFIFGAPEQEEDGTWYEPDQSGIIIGGMEAALYHADARYVTALNPEVVLALIAERRLWEKRALESLKLAEENQRAAQKALDLYR